MALSNEEVMEWTLRDVNTSNNESVSFNLRKAVKDGHYKKAEILMSLLQPSNSGFDSVAVHFWTSSFGKLHQKFYEPPKALKTFVFGLFNRYQNVTKVDNLGCNMLFDLSRQPRDTRVNELIGDAIAAGVSVDQQCRFGTTPAMVAVMHGNYVALEILVKHKADLSLVDKNKNNVLLWWANTFDLMMSGCPMKDIPLIQRIFKLLLNRGIDVNAQNAVGDTALILAALSDAFVSQLLSHGVEVNHRSHNDRYPGFTALHRYLHRCIADPTIVQKFLHCGADVDLVDGDGCTPIVYAVGQSNLPAICLLVWSNCSVNITYTFGRMPCERDLMMDALMKFNFQIIEILMEAGYSQKSLYAIMDMLRYVEALYKDHRQEELRYTDDYRLRAYQQIFVTLPEYKMKSIQDLALNPQSLSHICRMAIRSRLGKGEMVAKRIQCIGLPSKLQSYLALEHLNALF